MKLIAALACAASLALCAAALADGSSFTENQSSADQLFHIDVAASYLQTGQPPRDSNFGVGTIKISLPGARARFDPGLEIDQAGYTCTVTSSAYGEPGAGYLCSSDGQAQGNGVAFANTVTVHLLSQDCYAPPPEGSAQPAIAEVWAAPGDPGTVPDSSFTLTGDPGCGDGADEPAVDPGTSGVCVVPRLKNVALAKATLLLKRAGCKRGKLTYVYSRSLRKGRVLSQSVKGGKRVAAGKAIRLVVSLGKKPGAR